MTYSMGIIEVECPECRKLLRVVVIVQGQRLVGETLQVLVGVDQQKLTAELAEHAAEYH